MTTRLHIDWTRCDGRGLCAELLARRLGRDDWGYPIALDGGATRSLDVSDDELDAAEDAVRLCPVHALRLVTDP